MLAQQKYRYNGLEGSGCDYAGESQE